MASYSATVNTTERKTIVGKVSVFRDDSEIGSEIPEDFLVTIALYDDEYGNEEEVTWDRVPPQVFLDTIGLTREEFEAQVEEAVKDRELDIIEFNPKDEEEGE